MTSSRKRNREVKMGCYLEIKIDDKYWKRGIWKHKIQLGELFKIKREKLINILSEFHLRLEGPPE